MDVWYTENWKNRDVSQSERDASDIWMFDVQNMKNREVSQSEFKKNDSDIKRKTFKCFCWTMTLNHWFS